MGAACAGASSAAGLDAATGAGGCNAAAPVAGDAIASRGDSLAAGAGEAVARSGAAPRPSCAGTGSTAGATAGPDDGGLAVTAGRSPVLVPEPGSMRAMLRRTSCWLASMPAKGSRGPLAGADAPGAESTGFGVSGPDVAGPLAASACGVDVEATRGGSGSAFEHAVIAAIATPASMAVRNGAVRTAACGSCRARRWFRSMYERRDFVGRSAVSFGHPAAPRSLETARAGGSQKYRGKI